MKKLRDASRALTPYGLTILRLAVGFIMAFHGWTKVADFSGWEQNVARLGIPAPQLFAALSAAAELGGGLALMLGFLTPIAALGIFINMLVAIFAVHAPNGLDAQRGGYEYPLLIAAVALFYLVRGAGPFSLDRLIFGMHREIEPDERVRPPIFARRARA